MGRASSRSLSPARVDTILSLGPHVAVSLHVCVLTSCYKDPSPIGSEPPCDLIYLSPLCKDPVYKYSHIPRCWAQDSSTGI